MREAHRINVPAEFLQDALNEHRLPDTIAIAELSRDPETKSTTMLLSFAPSVAGAPPDILASLMMQMAHELIQCASQHSADGSVEQRSLEQADMHLLDAGRAWMGAPDA